MQAPLEANKPPAAMEVLEPALPVPGGARLGPAAVYGTREEQTPFRALLRRHRRAVALIFAASLLGGGLYAGFAPKTYKAETILEVTGLNHDLLGARDVDVDAGRGSPDGYLETQVDILQSDAVADRVVAALARDGGTPGEDPARREAGLRRMLAGLKAKEEGQSDLVQISLTGPDPRLTAEAANQLTRQYIEQGEETRLAAASETGSFLTKQLADAKRKLADSEQALQDYARQSGIVLTDDTHESVATERLRELQQGLAQAQLDAAQTAAQAEAASHGAAETLPEVVSDPALRDDLAKLTELRREMADLGTTLTAENPRVARLQAQIAELEAAVKRQRGVIVSKLDVQNQQARRRQQLLELTYRQQLGVVSDQGGKQVRYNLLKHEADVDRTVYQSMLQQARQAGVVAAMRAPNARVVSPAKTPRTPYSPKPAICGLISVLLGGVLSALWILLAERNNRAIRLPGESGQRIDCAELAVIPEARLAAKTQRSLPAAALRGLAADAQHPMLKHWKEADRTFMAEAYRSAVASILFSRRGGKAPKVLLLTSPLPQCGKTVTSANLAVSLAEGGRRVLLIDGDLRRPALPRMFGMDTEGGLTDTLDEEQPAAIGSLIRATGFRGVSILASGEAKTTTGKLLHSPLLGPVIEAARRDYDFVLIDAPPLLGLSDARLLARHADGLILVCRAGQTHVADLEESRKLLQEDGVPVLGTILNGYDLNRERSSHYASYLSYVSTH